MERLHSGKSKFHTHQWIKYSFLNLELGVSEDSDTLSDKNGSVLFLLCLIIGKLYKISKILMFRAHIDKSKISDLSFSYGEKLKSATFLIHFV